MKIITRYFLSEFLKIFITILVVFVFIYVFVDFLEKIDNFIDVDLPLTRIAQYYLLSTPMFIFNAAPVAVLVSVMISMGLLARNNEITAVKATGMSLYRVSVPLILASIVISIVLFGLSEMVIPTTTSQTNRIWKIEVEKKQAASPDRFKNVWLKNEGVIYNFDLYDRKEKSLQGINVFRLNDKFALFERTMAKKARFSEKGWTLYQGQVKTYHDNGQVKLNEFDEAEIKLPQMPDNFSTARRAPEEMGFMELYNYANWLKGEGHDPTRYFVDLNFKISYPFICLIMVLIGLPIVFWQQKGGGIAVGIGTGVGLSFLYLVFLGLSRSLGYTGILFPIIAAWVPNLFFMFLSMFFFAFVKQ